MDYKNKYFKYKKKYNNLKSLIEQRGGVNVNNLVKITDGNIKTCDDVKNLDIYKGNVIKPGQIYFSFNYDSQNKKINLEKGMRLVKNLITKGNNPNDVLKFNINDQIEIEYDKLSIFPILREKSLELENEQLENEQLENEQQENENFAKFMLNYLNKNTTYYLNNDIIINVTFNENINDKLKNEIIQIIKN